MSLLRTITALAALFVFATAASAQDENAATPPNWLVNCSNASGADTLQCSMSQSVVLTQTGARVLTASVSKPAGGDEPQMMVTLPHGLFLPAGVRMSIDGSDQDTLVVQTCEAAGCYAAKPIDKSLLRKLKSGKELKFVIQDLQKRNIDLALNLDGFADSFSQLER